MVDSKHTCPENELFGNWGLIAVTGQSRIQVGGQRNGTNDNIVANANPSRKQGQEIAMNDPTPLERKGSSQIRSIERTGKQQRRQEERID